MADTTPTLREAAQRLLNAIEAVHEAEKSEGHARGGFVRTAPTRAHQRRVAEAWHENAAAVQALRAALAEQAAEEVPNGCPYPRKCQFHGCVGECQAASAAEQARPDIIERLTYHALERDDLTPDDCLAYLAEGWKRVRGRTERQMVLQLTALLAGAPAAEQAEPQWQLERMRHIANEWADMATNGLQWLRNIKEGISNVDDALANMARCYEHCRRVNDAQGLYGEAAPPAPAAAEQAEPYTYASTQSTKCASCGERKHTPLRIDAMGGYVCLTCIDKKLGSLLGEFGHPAAEQAEPVAWQPLKTAAQGRAAVATFFRDALKRHDFDTYISTALAADFACVLGGYLTAPPAPARQEWQPIETAPKTGAKIIVRYVNRNNKPRTVMARWLTDEQAEETDADGVGLKGGWYECIDNWDDYTEVAIHEGEPSLWMPLPAAPITAAPAEGGAA